MKPWKRAISIMSAMLMMIVAISPAEESRDETLQLIDSNSPQVTIQTKVNLCSVLLCIDKREGLVNRKVDITPRKTHKGINKGLVIAYGHVIPPPYEISCVDNQLFVNGVRVYPSIINTSYFHRKPLTAEEKEQADFVEELEDVANRIYWRHKDKLPSNQLKDKVMDFIKSNKGFLDARWHYDEGSKLESIYIKWKVSSKLGEVDKFTIFFESNMKEYYLNPKPTKEQIEAFRLEEDKEYKKRQIQFIEQYNNELERGKCLIFDSDTHEHTLNRDIREIVNEIMQNSSLSAIDRAKMLNSNNVRLNETVVMDIIANYNPTEWKTQ